MRKSKNMKRKKIFSAILMASLLFGMTYTLPQAVSAAETEEVQTEAVQAEDTVSSADKKDIVIEVVEEIPADTIEDEDVPLAATPATATHTGSRVLVPVAVAVVIVLTWFYGRNRRSRAELRLYQER
ncbi:MAG: hypothetical protein E7236_05475 [Lachnospiraceae bacterium]|nr:hypothetical protein [Lachnospiraceae bacterium]